MGIDTGWKSVLEAEIGMPRIRNGERESVNVIVDDMSLNERRVMAGVETWTELGERLRARIIAAIQDSGNTLDEYWVLWDCPSGVPRNKSIEQARRRRYGPAPFTDQEMQYISIGRGQIPGDTTLYFARLMATRALHAELHAFMASELALTPLPPGTKLIMDGMSGHIVRDRALLSEFQPDGPAVHGFPGQTFAGGDYPVTFTNVRTPNNIFEDVKGGYARLDSAECQISVTHDLEKHTVRACVNPVLPVGEADLKIPRIISQCKDDTRVLVRCYDTDQLPILLLHMKFFIIASDDNLMKLRLIIFLDLAPPGKIEPEINMSDLWRIICLHLKTHFPAVSRPIETLVTLLLLTGGDYTTKLPRITPKAVWSAFARGGHQLIFDSSKPHEPGILLENVIANEHGEILLCADGQTARVTHTHVGAARTRTEVLFREQRWIDFVAYCYWSIIVKNAPWDFRTGELDAVRIEHEKRQAPLRENVRARAAAALAEGAKAATSNPHIWSVPSDRTIQSALRRLHWDLHYKINASSFEFLDPFEVDSAGCSVRGWRRDPDTGQVELAEIGPEE